MSTAYSIELFAVYSLTRENNFETCFYALYLEDSLLTLLRAVENVLTNCHSKHLFSVVDKVEKRTSEKWMLIPAKMADRL